MAVLTASRKIEWVYRTDPRGDMASFPMSADIIYAGSLVGVDATGYAQPLLASTPGTTLAGFSRFVGIAAEEVDNSAGSAGDKNIQVVVSGAFYHAVSGLAVGDVGTPVYASDESVIGKAAEGGVFVGWVERYEASGYGVIRMPYVAMGASHPKICRLSASIETAAANKALIIHPTENQNGLLVHCAYALITEVMGGGTEDQGIITLEDTDGTDICTFTPSDAGADALNDFVPPAANKVPLGGTAGVTLGSLMAVVAAGKGIQAYVSQLTSGTSEAGAMKVYVEAIPCAVAA